MYGNLVERNHINCTFFFILPRTSISPCASLSATNSPPPLPTWHAPVLPTAAALSAPVPVLTSVAVAAARRALAPRARPSAATDATRASVDVSEFGIVWGGDERVTPATRAPP